MWVPSRGQCDAVFDTGLGFEWEVQKYLLNPIQTQRRGIGMSQKGGLKRQDL